MLVDKKLAEEILAALFVGHADARLGVGGFGVGVHEVDDIGWHTQRAKIKEAIEEFLNRHSLKLVEKGDD